MELRWCEIFHEIRSAYSHSSAGGRTRGGPPPSEISPGNRDDGSLGSGRRPEASRELLRDAEIVFCELPPDNFDDLEKVRWIQLTSAGYAQVLNLPILARGIRVSKSQR